nr:helix-turn-helix transcriptional regulator [Streptomyces sp. TRM64462]
MRARSITSANPCPLADGQATTQHPGSQHVLYPPLGSARCNPTSAASGTRRGNIDDDRRFTKPAIARYQWRYASTFARNRSRRGTSRHAIEILRTRSGISQRQLAARCTALGHPMSNTTVSRIERVQRRCDTDDLVAIAQALHVPPTALLREPARS